MRILEMSDLSALSRRELLTRMGGGLGALGLASTVQAGPRSHFLPKAKRVIHLFMNGGPFGPDFFDPKPGLVKYAGQKPEGADLRTERPTGGLLASPYGYAKHGQSGLEISELLPNLARHADDLCVLRSCHTDNPNHGPALLLMNNGTMTERVPSMGSWLSYGLGNENANLPSFVVLCPGKPVRFSILWSSAFLPAQHQGVYINHSNLDPKQMIPWLTNERFSPTEQRKQLDLMQALNAEHLVARGGADVALNGRIQAMETAFRMQSAATDAFDVNLEPAKVREMYGTSHFSNGCLMARRLVERGVRFVQLYYGNGQPWDSHSNHDATTRKLAADIDRPIAALIGDLKQRGMLDDTLIVWGGEFGRTPMSEKGTGRDHNPTGFTMWMAGGGVKGGQVIGTTDEFGLYAVEDRLHVHDLHATIRHLLGINHEHLVYSYKGRPERATMNEGEIYRRITG